MNYPYENLDQAKKSELFRLTLAFLTQHQIPPCPINYRLGYDYICGENDDIKNVINEALTIENGLSQDNLWEIYERFFVQDNQALEKIRQELRNLLSSTQGEFKQSQVIKNDFADKLNSFSDTLESADTLEGLAADINNMIATTQSTIQKQQKVDTEMSQLVNEVEALRCELEQIKEESLTDALTGIANRRSFDAELEKSILEAQTQNVPMCLCLIDIDHFKKFNDTFGHLIGDKVLRFVSSILARSVKGRDFAARFGGEEFALILPNTSHLGGKAIAEQVRKAISMNNLTSKDKNQNYGRITASFGIAEYNFDESIANLIKRCDEALYKAKELGRNRVVVS